MQQTSSATKATCKQNSLKRVGKYKNCVIIDNGNQISNIIQHLCVINKIMLPAILHSSNQIIFNWASC